MHKLRDAGNTLVVVEHDPQIMIEADRLIDMGPGAGEHGGRIVFNGHARACCATRGSLTGEYLAGRRRIEAPRRANAAAGREGQRGQLTLEGASCTTCSDVNAPRAARADWSASPASRAPARAR